MKRPAQKEWKIYGANGQPTGRTVWATTSDKAYAKARLEVGPNVSVLPIYPGVYPFGGVKKNPDSRAKRDYMNYLEHTIIPDSIEAGREFTAEDLQTVLDILKTGSPSGGWRTIAQFTKYLRETLIPDLKEAGSEGYVKDFRDGLRFMGATKMQRNPLKLKPVGSNMTEMVLSVPGIRGETKVLFSYETPVAAYNFSPEWHERFDGSFIRTEKKWSVTTSKHINKWLEGAKAKPVPQEVLDNLETGVEETNPARRKRRVRIAYKRHGELKPHTRRAQVWQDPGNYKWFINYNGLMDTDAGYFDTEAAALRKARSLYGAAMSNPHKRRSKKKPSPAQLAARKRFTNMVRDRAKAARSARMKVTRHKRGTATRYKFSRPVARGTAEAMIAAHKRLRRNPAPKFLCRLSRKNDTRKWYLDASCTHQHGAVTDVRGDAKRYRSEGAALAEASALTTKLQRHNFAAAFTERA